MSNTMVIKGNIAYTKVADKFEILENGYIVVQDGLVKCVCQTLPSEYASASVTDYGDKLIIPGFVDSHVHAPQFENMGLGYDKELLPWLETYTFPEETKYKSVDYAKSVYSKFVDSMYDAGTTRAVVFGTVHKDSTIMLMDLIIKKGLGAYVGKVNMDRNSVDTLAETTEGSIKATEEFINETINKSPIVKPIITPRFVPTCTPELMTALGEMAKKYNIKIQSHLSENIGEIEWVKFLHPESKNYGDVYSQFGLFGQMPTIMAHCVYSPKEEVEAMKQNGVFVSHCPDSNTDLSSGIAPISDYMKQGLNVALGSDVSGGHSISMCRAIVAAIQVSKLYTIYVDKNSPCLTTSQAFYIATKGGGKFFGKVGSFEESYEFDALVIDDKDMLPAHKRTVEERLQKFIFTGENSNIVKRYVAGKLIG